jgi:hypothetical protein
MSAPTTGEFLNQTTPPATTGDQTVIFQSDGATPLQSITAVPKRATGSLFGTVKPDGTTIVIAGGVITAVAAGGAQLLTANYTAVTLDANTLLVFNSPTPVTLTLPAVPPAAKWTIATQNLGAGVLTINRNGRLLDTVAANQTLTLGQGVDIFTDGTDYLTERGAFSSPLTTKGDLFGHSTVDARFAVGVDGQGIVADSSQALGMRWSDRVSGVGITIDGGGAAPAAGLKGLIQIPFAGTITGWAILTDVSGSASVEIWKVASSAPPSAPAIPTSGNKISASAPASLSSAQSASVGSSGVSTWTTSVAAWDVFGFKLISASVLTRLTIVLQMVRS